MASNHGPKVQVLLGFVALWDFIYLSEGQYTEQQPDNQEEQFGQLNLAKTLEVFPSLIIMPFKVTKLKMHRTLKRNYTRECIQAP